MSGYILVVFTAFCFAFGILFYGVEMDSDEFWILVESASVHKTENEKADALFLLLSRKKPEEILGFQIQLDAFLEEGNTAEIYAAAKLMNGGKCSDDCFEYFRYWLISMGAKTYSEALKDPESLAKADVPFEDGLPNPSNERFGYVAGDVFEKSTGKNIHSELRRLGKEKVGISSLKFPPIDSKMLRDRFPILWKKYGSFVAEYERHLNEALSLRKVGAANVEGIGIISAGTKIHHKRFGVGVVESLVGNAPGAMVRFDDGSRFIFLDKELIDPLLEGGTED